MSILSFTYPIINLPQGDAIIAPECMGYRSMIALTILVIGYSLCNRLSVKSIFKYAGMAIVLAALFNVLRILICTAVGYYFYEFAFGRFHDIFGYCTFSVALWIAVTVVDKEIDKCKENVD